MSSDIPDDKKKKPKTVHDCFVDAATLLGGDVPRWKAAAGERMGISRGYMHHLTSGLRPLTPSNIATLVEAGRVEAAALRERAVRLSTALDDLVKASSNDAASTEQVLQPEQPVPVEKDFVTEFLDGLMADEEAKELSAKRT